MKKPTSKEQLYYILGCTEAKAIDLSKEINVPVEQCRKFLINQIIKYIKTKSHAISIEDLIKYKIIRDI